MSKLSIARAVRLALLTAGATGAALATVASRAQDQLEEITVTGSRIIRQDYEAASPVVTISGETFDQQGVVNAEQLVNTLPQVVPSFSTGNNNPGGGQAFIDLRGLGSVRTLVLVDGKRMTPGDENGRVDINTIPTGLIERVEIVSGGASAVYGSDAVAGAVNFILKKNFDGVEFGGQFGMSEIEDAQTQSFDVTMGSDLAEGRGNVVIFGSFDERDALSKGERAFSAQAVSTTSYFPMGAWSPGANLPTQAAVDALFQSYNVAPGSVLVNDAFAFNQDGSLFATSGADSTVIQNFRGDPNDLYVASNFYPGRYIYNFEPWNNLIIPQERVSVGAMGTFTVSDKVEAYARVLFTNYSSSTQLAPSPAPTGTNSVNPGAGNFFSVPVTNPFIQANADLMSLLNSRNAAADNPGLNGAGATEDFLYRRRFVENGPRIESYERDAYQAVIGMRGDISDKWRFDAYFAHGKLNGQENQDGNVRVSAVEALLDAPDGGASLCAGGFNPIGQDRLSPECAAFIGVLAKNTANIEQNLAEIVVSGDLFELPAGMVSSAFGGFYQKQNFAFLADSVLASGDVSGFNAQDNIVGSIDHTDLFAEFYVPLLSELPAVQLLSFTAGYRVSDHSNAGSNSSYKGELDWHLNDQFRVRGSYQRAVRAPNIGDLFSPQEEDNPDVSDPCEASSTFRTGPNGAQVRALCLAQGVPAALIDIYTQPTDQIDALSGGNPNLFEESADTYTVGLVFRPESLDRFSISLDYYDITVKDVIASIDPVTVVNRCYGADGANPNFELDNFYCNLFGRGSVGEINDLLEISNNLATLETSGIDLQTDFGFSLGNLGDLNLNLVATFVQAWDLQNLPGDDFLDYNGTIGEDPGEALPKVKGTFSAQWSKGNFGATTRLRYLDGMEHAASTNVGSTDPDICECTKVPETWYVDLSGTWQATEALQVRLGVDNLTDQAPRLYTPDADSGTDPSTYDVIGRKYFVSATYRF